MRIVFQSEKFDGREPWVSMLQWNENIRFERIRCGGVNLIHLAQDTICWLALVIAVMNLCLP
jgi:hypothetical protein